jgi:hypothetical protein
LFVVVQFFPLSSDFGNFRVKFFLFDGRLASITAPVPNARIPPLRLPVKPPVSLPAAPSNVVQASCLQRGTIVLDL